LQYTTLMSLGAFPSLQNEATKGLLLVGHGTRQQAGLTEFFEVADQVQRLATEFIVEPCFLEIAQPDIVAGVQRLLNRGVKQIVVSPVLLFAAGHAKRDIPAAVQTALLSAEGVTIHHAPPLECQPGIVELSSQRFAEAVAERPQVPFEDTLLLMVGRGNSDATAIAEMHRFAALRAERSRFGQVAVCFVAMAEPSLESGLRLAAESPYQRIVVQPHLLFAGQVLDQIDDAVAKQSSRHAEREWITAAHLGPSPWVAESIVELCRRCGF
jgi:sirohydrochlorin cobaltochelatase